MSLFPITNVLMRSLRIMQLSLFCHDQYGIAITTATSYELHNCKQIIDINIYVLGKKS